MSSGADDTLEGPPPSEAAAGDAVVQPPSPRRESLWTPSFDARLPKKAVYRVVITGGPCAGKTTSMARVTEFLRARGFRVFIAPESATMLWKGGATPDDLSTAKNRILFQRKLMELQMTLEESFAAFADLSDEPVVIMCDRGCMDGAAYMDAAEWETMLGMIGKNELELRDLRYNAVIHLVTAAWGAEKHYSKSSNETRYEPPEAAREVDLRLQKAWQGHPQHYVIDNRTPKFDDKLARVVDAIAQLVGLPTTFHRCRKYVLDLKPEHINALKGKCLTVKEFCVEKTYLAPSGDATDTTHFVRRRWSPDAPNLVACGLTSQAVSEDGAVEEKKQIINETLYNHLVINHKDPTRLVVKQERWCCMWEDENNERHYFEIHKYMDRDLNLLYVQLSDSTERGKVPPFLSVVEEVTGKESYSANYLSKPSHDSPTP
eukprot:m.11555 g.11555  ORF g.11555 m.11555 type:complete len:432 (-) comp2853_c0_seq1:115-1410(-)